MKPNLIEASITKDEKQTMLKYKIKEHGNEKNFFTTTELGTVSGRF